DPLAKAGCTVKRFGACVPIWGLSPERKRQMVAIGGNLMSFDLISSLWREPELTVIHSHALGRLGGIGLTVARQHWLPFVVTIHGGVYDLPEKLRQSFHAPQAAGWEWGKVFGWLVRARHVLREADAIITCNPREAGLIRERHPDRRVVVQPHGVPAHLYREDYRQTARRAFPELCGRPVLLSMGRIDPVKNQAWLADQWPELLRRFPKMILVLAGACTDESYAEALRQKIERLALRRNIIFTGHLPPADPRLIGLLQEARAVVLPSISETFGLVILEAWAAGTAVISSRTSGASALIEHGKNGWLFDPACPATFHDAVDQVLRRPDLRAGCVTAGRQQVAADYDTTVLAGRMKQLYAELKEENHALRYSA
ncbi:MAG: glycosyltransferase family 4 protein, partial [Verrucomicrobiota bacterium]|nr:glycosyltransferase family 4 protein [Verrucomicrobiota bacterium]